MEKRENFNHHDHCGPEKPIVITRKKSKQFIAKEVIAGILKKSLPPPAGTRSYKRKGNNFWHLARTQSVMENYTSNISS